MSERILQVHNHGVIAYEQHLSEGDNVTLGTEITGGDENTEASPIECVCVNVRSSSMPVVAEFQPIDVASDSTPGPVTAVRTMVARGVLSLKADEVTVEQLKDILRDKDLAVSGTKDELIARLNDAE